MRAFNVIALVVWTFWVPLSEAAPTVISSVVDLQNIRNDPSGVYVLGRDIDAAGFRFTPIPFFNGVMDGGGYTIRNLTITASGQSMVGLFESSSGSIKNLTLSGVNITGGQYVGALAGSNYGEITNVRVSGIVSGERAGGGLVAINISGPGIFRSSSSAMVTISGSGEAGGLVAVNSGGTIRESFATGNVRGNEYAGGLIGTSSPNSGPSGGTIQNVYATGSVTGTAYVGGLVGGTYLTNFSAVYAIGPVSGVSNVGGLVGGDFSGNTVAAAYWDRQSTGQSTSPLGTSMSTRQLKSGALPRGFDPSVWASNSGQYPALNWQNAWVLPLSRPTVQQDFNCFGCYSTGKFHTAMDLTSSSKTVVAAAAGEVHAIFRTDSTANSWCEGGKDRLDQVTKTAHEYGNTVIVKHKTNAGNDIYTQYNHLKCISKALAALILDGYPSGDPRRQVGAQTYLGDYGGSGNKNLHKWPAHLHFEVKTFGDLAGKDPKNGSAIFSYSPAPGELYGYLDPVTYLYGNVIESNGAGTGIVVDGSTIAYEAPGLAIASNDPVKNKIPANALIYITNRARMPDGDWYQINLGLPVTPFIDISTKVIDNNSPEGWVHSNHIVPYFGVTFTVPGPQYALVDVFDAPDGVVVGKVLGGQVFQRYGQIPARTKREALCTTQWIEIHLGAVVSGPEVTDTRQRGWVCDTGT